ncbi:Transposon TX1 uncharacterized 149 kDa protein [Stylophora pistillata]|uniref:Transposon TX1 uncharacterized 149 kDa protein n=1 Tax=Stylophora pistillata TaxID=50429 RepID=A0A2B4REN5_STYPI|nr:Transposon TX1 uncharacterized 149 kDa protein [Stylophora pistillata]
MPDIEPANTPLPVNENRPDKAEIKRAIKRLKNGKAAGPDGIPPEAIKIDLSTSTEMLYELFGNIWETNEVPDDWKEGYLIKLPKKGDQRECKKWRDITLLSTSGKVLSRIILERLKVVVDKRLRAVRHKIINDRADAALRENENEVLKAHCEELYNKMVVYEASYKDTSEDLAVAKANIDSLVTENNKLHTYIEKLGH